ncbi:hypothetical protein E9993_20200 [Labilibacter sediminis]|nr:hypothetical protein E9993_20200 [Labilibacter sediminis]
MKSIQRKDQVRFDMLKEIYLLSDGDCNIMINFNELGTRKGFDSKEVSSAYNYLVKENMIEGFGAGSSTRITHEGVKVVESALRVIDFDEDKPFAQYEIYQLSEMLDDFKGKIERLELGQVVIFDKIDEVFQDAKKMQKKDFKKYFIEQSKNWLTAQSLTVGGKVAVEAMLEGLKIYG